MKISDLINKLSTLDPELHIVIFRNLEFGGCENGYYKDLNLKVCESDEVMEEDEGFFFTNIDNSLHKFILIE